MSTSHCELSPSSAYRWMHCPGSVRLARGVVDRGSSYAREGSAAHALAEHCLVNGLDPHECVGQIRAEDVEVTQEMADAVAVYVDYARKLALKHGDCWIEHKFDLAELDPPAPMYGTGDFGLLARDGTLHVVDFKYGAGVPVNVRGNPQLMYYALGAYLSLKASMGQVRRIELTVVQPRAPHADGPIRSVELGWADLVDFWCDLKEAAEDALAEDAPLVTGPHCQFCPVLAQCPEVQKQALTLAQEQFSIVQPQPGTLPPAMVAEALRACDEWLEDWIHALRAYALAELKAGRIVPGYKLVAKRATRQWRDEAKVERWLKRRRLTRIGHEWTLRSVAQMEKALGKGVVPESLYSAESSGVTLAAESDARPAVTAGQEFFAIEGGVTNGSSDHAGSDFELPRAV